MRKEMSEILSILFILGIVMVSIALFWFISKKFVDLEKTEHYNQTAEVTGEISLIQKTTTIMRYPAIAASSALFIVGIILCMYLLADYPSIDVYTSDIGGRQRKLGTVVAYKKGEILYGKIPEKMVRKSETGIYELHLNGDFADNNSDSVMIISVGNKTYREIVKDKINIREHYLKRNYSRA